VACTSARVLLSRPLRWLAEHGPVEATSDGLGPVRRGLLTLCLCCAWGRAHAAGAGLEILFVGDVNFSGRPVPAAGVETKNPLGPFAERFGRADVVVANAEGLLTEAPPSTYPEARLNIGASPVWAPAFQAAHVGVVGVANNHAWDGDAAAVLENLARLTKTGVVVIGAGKGREEAEAPWVLESGGRCRVAIVPATLKLNRPPRAGAAVAYYGDAGGLDRLSGRIRGLVERGCFVAVTIHWGREALDEPPPDVVAAGRRLVDAGARLVVGHHPHVLQGVELREGAAIVYSLGNFVFVNREPVKRRTGVLAVRLTEDEVPRLAEVAILPAIIGVADFAPRPASGNDKEAIVARLESGSRRFGTVVRDLGDRVVFGAVAP
jgi:poly-gamma-glutamate synthesis protein (capsule biosynthesis protein)